MKLLNVSADCIKTGNVNEYENAIDAFVFWCNVEFEIGGKKQKAVAQFDCGYSEDTGEWSEINSELLNVSAEQDTFIDSCLEEARTAMKELKSTL